MNKKMKYLITTFGLAGLFLLSFNVNSECFDNKDYCEYSPTVSADGTTLIYQADYHKKDDFKIYIKYKKGETPDGKTEWSDPVLLENVNSKFLDGGCFITYDQNHLIITSNRNGGQGSADLWMSTREGDNWTVPVNLGEPINSSGYEGFASLSPDGNSLYFVRKCPEKKSCDDNTFGLFYSEKQNGQWTEPKKMPAPINTDFCEMGPTILADGVTLIFSSNRPGGLGGYDLYKTVKQQDGTWSTPVNLGNFINTELEDSLIAIPASGEIMYYTKALQKGSDISRIDISPIPEELRQGMVVTVSGVVKDASNPEKLLYAQIKILDSSLMSEPIIIESNKNDGSYIVILNKGKNYNLYITKEGYTPYSANVDLTNLKKYQNIKKDILLEPVKIGETIILKNIQFAYNSHKLLKVSVPELTKVYEMLKSNPNIKIEISGHTDNLGSAKFNRKLSRMRADSVKKYLIKKGIDKKRLAAIGYGELVPIMSNTTEKGRETNRRVEIKILKYKE